MDLNKYPTIAISDGFNSICCWIASHYAYENHRPDISLGIGLVALASSVGTLRFGFAPSLFAKANEVLAKYAGMVGVPLIGIGYMRKNNFQPEALDGSIGLPTRITLALLVAATFLNNSKMISIAQKELYTTLVCVASFAGMLMCEIPRENWGAVGSVVAFVAAGLAVGADRHRYILGVRRENIFHYILGSSMLGFAWSLKH